MKKLKISNFDKGIRLGLENLVEYSEQYLFKAKEEGNEKVGWIFIKSLLRFKRWKLLKHLERMEKERKIDRNKKRRNT